MIGIEIESEGNGSYFGSRNQLLVHKKAIKKINAAYTVVDVTVHRPQTAMITGTLP
jgi:hypothetical protein